MEKNLGKQKQTAKDSTQAKGEISWDVAVNKVIAELAGALINPSFGIDEIANIVLEQAKNLTESEHGYVSSKDPDTGDMITHTLTKMMGKQCRVGRDEQKIIFPVRANGLYPFLWGYSLNTRAAFYTNSPEKHEDWRGIPKGHIRIRNFLSVPALVGTEVVGQIALANSAGGYRAHHAKAISHIGKLYAVALQRKRAEETFRESEERFRALFEQAAVGVAQIETKTGRFLRVNQKYCEIVGYSVEELESRSVQEIIHPDDLQADQDNMKKLIKGDIPDFAMEKRYFHKKGKIVWVNITVSRMWGEGQEPNYHIAVIEDITERKNAEERRRLAGRILECLNRETAGLEVVRDVLTLIKASTGFDAVGIRLNEGNDFPYFETNGFSKDFLKTENYLCVQDKDGQPIYDMQGNPVLECMCGNVLSGRTNPALPFFTEEGSFWTNSTTELLASTSTEDLQGRTRNRCNREGYESVALIPLRSGNEIVGLLQLNDTKEGRFSIEKIRFFEEIGKSIGMGLARIQAEQDLENVAKFPWENPNPVLRISEDGTLLYANPAAYPIIEEWDCRTGQTVPALWRKTTAEVLENNQQKRTEYQYDNKIFAILVVPFAGAGYANLYGRDITERKRAEIGLKQSEERYAQAQRAANIGSWDLNIVTGELIWSDQIEPMFGFIRGQFGGTYEAFLDCVHPEDRQFVIDSVNACVEEGKDYAIEHRIIWPDGTVHWISEIGDVIRDDKNKAIRMLGIVQDITERVEAEREIEILAKFPSENPNPVLRISADGTLLYANHTADSMIQEWSCRIGQTVPDMWRKTIVEVLANKRQKRIEYRHDNKIFTFLVVPVTGAGYANLYGRDITDRKAAEEELHKHRQHLKELVEIRTAELREANKQLIAEIEERKKLEREILDISEREQRRLGAELHDSLGQQLTGIAFMIKVLEQKLAETSPNEVADVVEIAKLVEQATDQARGLARGLHPLDLGADSLMSLLEELARQTRELIGVGCFFRCDEAVKMADAGVAVHLYRIAQEAVTNAIKHGRAKNIEIALVCNEDTSVMTIRNDGLDFPKEFEARGTGMGLQIMDHRIDLLGGSLDVHADDEGGTILTCTFPNKNRG